MARPMNPRSILWPEAPAVIRLVAAGINTRIEPPTPPPPRRVREPRAERPIVILNRKE